MPSDLIVNVRQISNYPELARSDGSETILLQQGGLGGPYASISAQALVSTGLGDDGSMSVGTGLPVGVGGGNIFAELYVMPLGESLVWNAYGAADATLRYWNSGVMGGLSFSEVGYVLDIAPSGGADQVVVPGSATPLFVLSQAGALELPHGTLTVARDPAALMEVATLGWVGNNTVNSFNQRNGAVQLNAQDVYSALKLCDPIATQPWVNQAITNSLQNLLYTCPFVNTWNGRQGQVYLMLSDITCVFYQSGQQPISPTPAPTSNDDSIATTKWVINAFQPDGGTFLPISGGTLTGSLQISPTNTLPNQIFFTPSPPSQANVPQGSQFNSYLASQTTGGDFFDMYCNIRADTTIQGSGSTGITGILSQMTYNGDGGAGGYVPVYGQFSRRTVNSGGTAQNPEIWGAVFEVIDWTNTDSAQTAAMSGIEIDMTCGNTDSANNRRALGIYLNTANSTDTPPVCNMGIHIAANAGSYDTALKVETTFNIAAIDLRLAPAFSANAHAIWLQTGGSIALDTPASIDLVGDGVGGMILAGSAGNPARIIFQPDGNAGHQWWIGGWPDNNFYINDITDSQNRLIISADGAMTFNNTSIGFFNANPIAQPTVTGSAGGNAALDSLLTALANYGLIINNATP